jgi:hypothetical protein
MTAAPKRMSEAFSMESIHYQPIVAQNIEITEASSDFFPPIDCMFVHSPKTIGFTFTAGRLPSISCILAVFLIQSYFGYVIPAFPQSERYTFRQMTTRGFCEF